MNSTNDEISKREAAALSAIKTAFGTDADEYGATLFVSHHLEELEDSYWQKHLGTSTPEPAKVLGILTLHSHWGDEEDDGLDVFDFTLPDDATDGVISVRFDNAGAVEEISMES